MSAVRRPKILAVGYEITYRILKDTISNYLNEVVADSKMEKHVAEYIIDQMSHENWRHLIGIQFSKMSRGNPGIMKSKQDLERWFDKEYKSSLDHFQRGFCIVNALYFTYSKKKHKITYISVELNIKGTKHVCVIFATDKTSTSVIKKEILRGLEIDGHPKHHCIKFPQSITDSLNIKFVPYIHYVYDVDSKEWPGELEYSENHEIIRSLDELTSFKKKCEGIRKTDKRSKLEKMDPKARALLMQYKNETKSTK